MEINSQNLYSQIEEQYGKVMYTYTKHIIHANRLKKRTVHMKWWRLILSAITTGGFVGTLVLEEDIVTWIGGMCSTALLVVNAYFKDSELAETHNRHLDTANKLWLIRERYLSLLVDYEKLKIEEVMKMRDQLMKDTSEVYNKAPLADEKSYELAQKALKEEEAQFFSREELDKMLPIALRRGKAE